MLWRSRRLPLATRDGLKVLFYWVKFMKLKAEYETETYISAEGGYVIQQPDNIEGTAQSIYLSRAQVALIVEDMLRQLEIPEWGEEEA